jgi:hypothetical protein
MTLIKIGIVFSLFVCVEMIYLFNEVKKSNAGISYEKTNFFICLFKPISKAKSGSRLSSLYNNK